MLMISSNSWALVWLLLGNLHIFTPTERSRHNKAMDRSNSSVANQHVSWDYLQEGEHLSLKQTASPKGPDPSCLRLTGKMHKWDPHFSYSPPHVHSSVSWDHMQEERTDGELASEGLTTLPISWGNKRQIFWQSHECRWAKLLSLLEADAHSVPRQCSTMQANGYTGHCVSLPSKNGKSTSVLCLLDFENV